MKTDTRRMVDMKKIITILTTMFILVSLVGCIAESNTNADGTNDDNVVVDLPKSYGIKSNVKINDYKTIYKDSELEGKLHFSIDAVNDKKFEIKLKNISSEDIKLTFTSGQVFDLKLLKDGKEIYFWSSDKSFIAMISETELKAGEEMVFDVTFNELPLEKGEYEMELWCVAKEIIDGIALEVTFSVE